MIILENYDVEFPQIGKEPKIGYTPVYNEYIMLSGKVRRIQKGKRFVASFSYAFLTATQRALIQDLLDIQKNLGYVKAIVNTPYGSFNGNVIMSLNDDQARFSYSEVLQDYVWTNWKLTLRGVDLE